ncbi:hypothetical protein [Actinomadura madurae]|uniref:hypothetical protein n=1 Tax=Actinomadura madurae TaxID=1993 RepID=UPI0027E2F7B7|nr:hypothetical protein [Actinomadura madurae]
MSEVRVHNFAISIDGFATGEGQAPDAPFGHAGERLHEWMFTTRFWYEMGGGRGGSVGADNAFAVMHGHNIGAEIMGAASSARPTGRTTPTTRAPGAPTRRSTRRSSSSPTGPVPPSRWKAAPPSTS